MRKRAGVKFKNLNLFCFLTERIVHSKEEVLTLAMNIGDKKLIVKENYVVAKLSTFVSLKKI